MKPFLFFTKRSRRSLIRLVSYCLAGVVALSGGLILTGITAHRYRMQLEYTYERGLSELSEHLNNIEITLTKGLYTGTVTGATKLAMNLWSESGAAKTCLSQLPTYGNDLESTYKFLSQIGEYSLSLSQKLQEGHAITPEEHERLQKLSGHAKQLSQMATDLCSEMNQNGSWKQQIQQVVEQSDHQTASSTLFTGLKDLEESLLDTPTLLYDGPFSEHILQAKPLFLTGKAEIAEAKARSLASTTLKIETQDFTTATLTHDTSVPCYVYGTENTTIAITQQGGYVYYFNKFRNIPEQNLPYEQCISLAQQYLTTLGLGKFRESYYTVSEGVCLINFAFQQDDVICYTDLIKIGVALDNGEIVSYNAQGFVMNHHNRAISTPENTMEQAKERLSSYVTVQAQQKAIIPSNRRNPVLCYEFLCTGNNQEELLIYINSQTLEEEELLILLKTDGGTLTI